MFSYLLHPLHASESFNNLILQLSSKFFETNYYNFVVMYKVIQLNRNPKKLY